MDRQTTDNRMLGDQDKRALNDLLSIINNSVETKRMLTRTMINN